MAGTGFDQRYNFQNRPNMGGGGPSMNGPSNGGSFPSPPHGFAMNQQHSSPGGPLFGSAFPFNNNVTDANNNQIGFNNSRFMPNDNNHGVPPTPMNSPAFWQGPPNMNGIVALPFGAHPYGNGAMVGTQPMNYGRPPGYGGNATVQYDGRVAQVHTPSQVRSAYVGNPGNRSEYVFGGSNIIATIESTPGGAARILIGEGPANTLQARADALNSEYFIDYSSSRF